MSNFERCVIATRESPLAMWQALHIQSVLRARYPSASVELLGMTTRGDQILDRTLSNVKRILADRGEEVVTLKIIEQASSMMML